MKYEEAFISFIILFIIIFLVDYFLINKRKLNLINHKVKKTKEKKKKIKNISELDYLVYKFKLNEKKLKKEKVIIGISIINSFIIAIVSSIIMLLPYKVMWLMFIAFTLLFGLIYSLYELYGRYLQKQEKKEGEK